MDYLKSFVGRTITVSLTEAAREDRMMKLFYETNRHSDFIGNKLLGVDSIGIWLEGFKTVTKLVDENDNQIPPAKQVKQDITLSVLIRYEFLQGIAIINDENIDAKTVGFKI